MEKIIYSLNELDTVVLELIKKMRTAQVLTFTGPLGAGKTTVIRELLKQCGITQPVTSPTFTYVNRYQNLEGQIFYHFDLYRIESLDDFIAGGFGEYLYQPNSWAFIEWPELIMPILSQDVCHITIDYPEDNVAQREMTITCK
jgi:tRNA threonylcarbamoyladenosine biosynthesis protein TsaE